MSNLNLKTTSRSNPVPPRARLSYLHSRKGDSRAGHTRPSWHCESPLASFFWEGGNPHTRFVPSHSLPESSLNSVFNQTRSQRCPSPTLMTSSTLQVARKPTSTFLTTQSIIHLLPLPARRHRYLLPDGNGSAPRPHQSSSGTFPSA